jgi:hypothetical protein
MIERNRQLGLYSLAAAAAGVSILALTTPANGEVVVTHKTIRLPLSNLGLQGVGISFQNNGVDDLKLVLSNSVSSSGGNFLKAVNGSEGRGVLGDYSNVHFASAMPLGKKIGPSPNFLSAACNGDFACHSAVRLAYSLGGTFAVGPWVGNPKNAYLGVRFSIDGELHYGWVRLTVNTSIPYRTSATVTAYAYETEPNKPIYAGLTEKPPAEAEAPEDIRKQPGPSLGMLAAGAEAMPLWRSKE